MTLQCHFWAYIQTRRKRDLREISAHPYSYPCYSNVSINRWMDEQNVKLLRLRKEGNFVTRYNMDEPWGHYTKWNKPVTERQILYDPTYIRYIESSNSQRELEWWLRETGGGSNGELCSGYSFSLARCKRFEDLLHIVWIYLSPLNCTLKMVKVVNFMLCIFF